MNLQQIIDNINSVLWGNWQILIYILIFAGCWFTYKLKFVQLFDFHYMFKVIKHSIKTDKNKGDNSGISSLQALFIGLSARVGTGNLAGVAVAISLGGSGSIFWMWTIALLGMATGFAESILGQLYKIKDEHKEFRGGPAYYILNGLNKRWLAIMFSICLFLGYGSSFSSMQANTIADSLNHAFNIPNIYSGIVITILTTIIVLGGLKRIAQFAQLTVPFMAGAFILLTLYITVVNITALPNMLYDIITSAFGLQEAGAGMLGAAIKNGIQRGLYSNEAGAGSVPHAAAAAKPIPNHPVTQGYIQMFGVFVDTMVICTCTATIILLSDVNLTGEMEGIRLIQNAITYHLGDSDIYFASAIISLFAFTSVIGNYSYAESNLHLFKLDNKFGRTLYTLIYLSMVLWGSTASMKQVWSIADAALGLMTLVNIFAIIQLTPTIIALTRDYKMKRKQNNAINTDTNNTRNMEFKARDIQFQGKIDSSIWKE